MSVPLDQLPLPPRRALAAPPPPALNYPLISCIPFNVRFPRDLPPSSVVVRPIHPISVSLSLIKTHCVLVLGVPASNVFPDLKCNATPTKTHMKQITDDKQLVLLRAYMQARL